MIKPPWLPVFPDCKNLSLIGFLLSFSKISFGNLVIPVHVWDCRVRRLSDSFQESSRIPWSLTVSRACEIWWRSGPSGAAPGWNFILLGWTWWRIQYVFVSSQKSFSLLSKQCPGSLAFPQDASVIHPTLRFCIGIGCMRIPNFENCCKSSINILACKIRRTYGCGIQCWSNAVRPAMSGLLSFAAHAKPPIAVLSSLISDSVQRLYFSLFLCAEIGIFLRFWI